jgi:hypothetical protein
VRMTILLLARTLSRMPAEVWLGAQCISSIMLTRHAEVTSTRYVRMMRLLLALKLSGIQSVVWSGA